jgi:hypothetical protein
MLYLSKATFVYRFYKILVIEPTTEVKAESIGAPSVKEIGISAEKPDQASFATHMHFIVQVKTMSISKEI